MNPLRLAGVIVPFVFSTVLPLAVAHAQFPPAFVRTAPVQKEMLQERQRAIGSLKAIARGNVAALEAGQVLEVTVREGAHVKQGEVIARIDDRRLQAQLAEVTATRAGTEAMIAQREAELLQAQQDVERTEKLWERNASSKQELEHHKLAVSVARSRLKAAQRQLKQIESQLELLQVRLSDTTIKAPYNGYVVERHTEPGEWIEAGKAIVTLVSSGNIEAWLEVPERFAAALAHTQQTIEIEVGSLGQTFRAVRAKLVPQVHTRTRTFQYVVELENEDGLLQPGMSVNAWLPVGEKSEKLTVPKDAIVQGTTGTFVYRVEENTEGASIAVQVPARVLFAVGERVVIEEGTLKPGAEVIVEGNERLLPNSVVSVANDRAPHGMAQKP